MSKRGRGIEGTEAAGVAASEVEQEQQAPPLQLQQHRAAAPRGPILTEGRAARCIDSHDFHHHAMVGLPVESAAKEMEAVAMPAPSFRLPQGVILHLLSFLDGRALAACAQTCQELYEASDYAELWAAAGRAAYPQAATLSDVQAYGGEWKALLRDGNRRNRSAVFEWEVADCLGDSRRRYSPAFTLEDFTFQVMSIGRAWLPGCMAERS